MTPSPSSFFTSRCSVTPDVHRDLFQGFFEHTAFASWHSREGSWQLQITGGPGSGKTTLSAVVVEYLRREYDADNCRTASIFFRGRVKLEAHAFVEEVLGRVLRELSDNPHGSTSPRGEYPNIEDVRQDLMDRVKTLRHSFLILDDLDLCGTSLIHALQDDLTVLQQHGLKVMTTSRVPLHFSDREIMCDIGYQDEAKVVLVYWCCTVCDPPGVDFDWQGAYYICERHRLNGHGCPNDKDHTLYEPYRHVCLLTNTIFEQATTKFADLILGELELAHGNLRPPIAAHESPPATERGDQYVDGVKKNVIASHGVGKDEDAVPEDGPPPLSKLGLVLKEVPERVDELIRDVLFESSLNVSIAKLRTDIYQAAQTMDDLDKVADRLPDNVVAVFDAAMDRVIQQSSAERDLGLLAINIVCSASEAVQFSDLAKVLLDKGMVGCEAMVSLDDLRDRVIEATCGLLTVFPKEDAPVEPFAHLFRLYVFERYNEDVARSRDTLLPHVSEVEA